MVKFKFCFVDVLMALRIRGTTVTFHEEDVVSVFFEKFDMSIKSGDVDKDKWMVKMLTALSFGVHQKLKNDFYPVQLEGQSYKRVREAVMKTKKHSCRTSLLLI